MPRAIIPYTTTLPDAPWTKLDVYLKKLGEGDYTVRLEQAD